MISSKIINNDMAILGSPLTGVGTVHGLTIDVDVVIGQQPNTSTKKMKDVYTKFLLPEYAVGLMSILVPEMGVDKFKEFVDEHEFTDEVKQKFVDQYIKFAMSLRSKIIPSY
jgi:anaerobic C4-dicarboxylate transporter